LNNPLVRHPFALIGTAMLLILFVSGCSFSESSKSISKSGKSISKSISSPSKSSSRSSESSSPAKEKRYQAEVADYTAAYVHSSNQQMNLESFQHGLSEIAARIGIVNWESSPLTYQGIGKGLRKARLKGIEYETYKKNLSGGDYGKMQDIQKGYESKN